ncbi:MAG: glycoside hydrolase family 127 protein [Lentisphaeria bacterium]|nr:glycoside hydrolase family 127 protein [Lentisphaeria bacterium]
MKRFFWLLPCCVLASVFADGEGIVTKFDAWGDLSGMLHVRWITSAPAKGVVEFGLRGKLTGRVEEDASCLRGTTNNRDSGAGWANNHRADIAVRQWPVSVRVSGTTREGKAFATKTLRVSEPKAPAGTVARDRITLKIDAGDWREALVPVTVGVPFPEGALGGARNVRVLVDEKEIASQAVAVTRWHADLSVKWLRLSLAVPAGTKTAVLEYGRDVRVGRWPIDTQSEGGAEPDVLAVLRAASGKTYLSKPDGIVPAEEMGVVKNVLVWRGQFVAEDGGTLWQYVLRCHSWTGIKAKRWEFTVENDRTEKEMTSIRSLVLHPWPTKAGSVKVGLGDMQVALALGGRVLQREDFEWMAEPSGEKGKRMEGVARISPAGRQFVLRNFWQQWPASIELGRDGVFGVGLCPALPADFYAGREDEDKFYYQVRDGLHTFRQGFSKTWEFWTGQGDPKSFLGERPVASVPPEWVEKTFALRNLAVACRTEFAGYDETLKSNIDSFPAGRDQRREFGMMNFGDWYGERRWNWGNLEYDLGHAFLTQFARTGEAAFWRRSEEIIRHQRDVDTRHYARDSRRVGQQWIHSMGHTAGYYDNGYKHMKRYAGSGWSDNRGHIWAQGMFEQYLMGGDKRSWETALLISDWAAGPQTTNFRFGNAREPGWMTKLVVSAYLATEDPFYLNAAKIMLDITHAKSLATGDHGFYYHKLPNGHCNCPDNEKHYGEAGFMLGVLMTGMKMYYDVTGDKTVADDIAKTAQFIWENIWDAKVPGFHYTPCPHSSAGSGSGWIMLEGLSFGARHSGSAKQAALCRTALMAAWSHLPQGGKGAGSALCASAQALDGVGQLPGGSFAEERARLEAIMLSPARRPLPTTLPNPDFEEGIQGWPSRGWAVERCTDVRHSGQASLKISGEKSGQNEYVNTTYNSSSSPYEISWLEPGGSYVLSAWLRVDRITPGAPAPCLRITTRDGGGSRGAVVTNAYDLSKRGTWQKLLAHVKIPSWNTRNYIALNTNTGEAVEVLMYLDDVRVVPGKEDPAGTSTHIRLDPSLATLTGGATSMPADRFRGEDALCGAGAASWDVSSVPAGAYTVWIRADEGAKFTALSVNGSTLCRGFQADALDWHRLGKVRLAQGPLAVVATGLAKSPLLGRIVLTTERMPAP